MLKQIIRQPAVVAGIVLFAFASIARADEWNERTTLTFSEPVMVPGATLQPGTYVFELADANTSRHIVQIRKESGPVVTTAQAVPLKRGDAKSDVVLKFNPTDRGTPPALKAWFYPGSLYGHQFVYSDREARKIAERTRTVVLSTEVPGTDLTAGTLYTYDQSAITSPWKGDPVTMREWDAWQSKRGPHATVHQRSTSADSAGASAPMMRGNFDGMRVSLDDLEDNPAKYVGQSVSVDGEVEEVFGPRLFTIDEANWGDLDGEILVYVPSPLAALVQDDDKVTVSGVVRRFVKGDVEREWGWMGLDAETEVEFSKKPVLVASRVTGGNDNMAMVIDTGAAHPVGTSGGSATDDARAPLTSLNAVANGDADLIGRRVRLASVPVAASAEHGFFAGRVSPVVYVLASEATFKKGDVATIEGVILQMPRGVKDDLSVPARANDDIYIYATEVGK
jgi:hypothetical protein